MTSKTYSELLRYETFEERYEYLRLFGAVGNDTFGFDRYMNQQSFVIARDEGRDLAMPGREIYDRVIIHHMNPMTPSDIASANEDILDPEFLICVAHDTHNAIHYGDASLLKQPLVERRPGDTRSW
jgi:hypothetical protein